MGSRVRHSRVEVRVRCVEDTLNVCGHVVIGVVLGFTTQTQSLVVTLPLVLADAIPLVEFFPSGLCSPFLHS